VIFRCKRPL